MERKRVKKVARWEYISTLAWVAITESTMISSAPDRVMLAKSSAKRQELAVGCILFDVMTACMLASKVNYGTVVVISCHFAMVVKVWTLFG